jgi:imidazolonepropionase
VKTFVAHRIVTCDPARASEKNPLGVVERASVTVDGETIVAVGHAEGKADSFEDCVITPGLVDAHTHAAWVGSRHTEYAIRMAGGDYRAIAAAGGGILASQRAVAAASQETIERTLAARLRRMSALGVTTVEVKSGYGLEPEQELKQLRAIASVAARDDIPRVVPTFLALHALPETARADRAAYVQRVAAELVPKVAAENLARFVDAYVDANAFSVEEARTVGLAARGCGLGVRLHVGQFADVGGAELCAELGARSADHLENVGDRGIAQLAGAGTHAVLLPVASFTLAQAPPPVARLRAAGVPLVVASDANPGTAPTESLPLALALAVRAYGLSPDEALLGATRLAAASLDLAGVGAIKPGAPADLVVWDLPHEHAIVQPWGAPRARMVLRGGREVGPHYSA